MFCQWNVKINDSMSSTNRNTDWILCTIRIFNFPKISLQEISNSIDGIESKHHTNIAVADDDDVDDDDSKVFMGWAI